jgi:hypothetical protein
MNNTFKALLFSLVLVTATTFCKYFFGPMPAFSGFSPVIAIALFSGYTIRQKEWVFFFSLIALVVSDLFIELLHQNGLFDYAGIYAGQWKNYLLLLSSTWIGYLLRGRSYKAIFAGAFWGPTLFFLLSNGLVWLQTAEVIYAKDGAGLMTCYVAGLPFYNHSLLSTLVFLPAILFVYNYLLQGKRAVKLA